MHLGFSRLGLGRFKSGAAGPAGSNMKIGFNVQPPYYGGNTNSVPFANLMWQGERWQYSGGFWANQDQGITSGNPGTQVLYSFIADSSTGSQLPAGTYTFRNPAGNNVAVGIGPGGSDYIAWTTSTTEQQFTLPQNAPICVSIKGDATNPSGTRTGGIQIILPGHVASWDAGDYFNSAWVSFHQNANTQLLRFMDMHATNTTIGTDWANQGSINKITLNTVDGGRPWEVIIAAANKLNKPALINIPVRATDAYVSSLGSLLSSTYTPSQVFVEYGNETWNYINPFYLSWNWLNGLTFTKKTVAVNPLTGLCTLTAHGWANNNVVHSTISHAGRALNWWNEDEYYLALWGGAWYVKVIDANTFELWSGTNGTGTKMDLSSGTSGNTGITELLMWNEAEAGKTIDNNGNHATRLKQIADLLDVPLPGKVKIVLGSQSANAGGVTQPRLANATATARVDYLATAPYYNSTVLAGAIDRTTNTFTPKVWSYAYDSSGAAAPVTCYFGVYSQGSTPTAAQVIAGTGTGFVVKPASSWTHTYSGTAYASGGAVSVVNGTTYTVFFVVTDTLGCTWMWSQDVAAANVTDTVDVLDTYANQTARALYSLDSTGYHNIFATAKAHKDYIAASAKPSIQLLAYECNSHENYSFPTSVNTWHEAWMGDATGGGVVMTQYLSQMAAAGFQYANIFLDVAGAGPWGTASSTYDTTDGRYLAVKAFNGNVPVRTAIDLGPVSATRISAAPGTYPYIAYTFSDPTLSYRIMGGNNDALWDISGATVRLLNSTGINYSVVNTYVLKIQATDGNVVSNFDLTMATGPAAWYETDALIAWNSVSDITNSAINPDIGTTMTLAAGSGAIISGGLWDPQGTTQYSAGTSGLVSGIDYSKPLLAIVVVDRNSASTNGATTVQFGTFPKYYQFNVGGTAGNSADISIAYVANTADYIVPYAASGTARAVWVFTDPVNAKVYYGYNQTQLNTGGGSALPADWGTPGISGQNCFTGLATTKFGSFEVVNRTGMTITDALAIVQKVQNLHGI